LTSRSNDLFLHLAGIPLIMNPSSCLVLKVNSDVQVQHNELHLPDAVYQTVSKI